MREYHMTKEELAYLDQYDITQFDRPSIAADMAVFSILADEKKVERQKNRSMENYRKMPERKLKLLLIRRAAYPYKDCWALPGGFCQKDEDVRETARRELYEETHIKNAYLEPIGIYGEAGRDPRGWIISHNYMALLDGEKCKLRAGSDAWEARWFEICFEKTEKKKEIQKEQAKLVNEYSLKLVSDEITLKAKVRENRVFSQYHETVTHTILSQEGLAFDHAKLITCAVLALQRQVESDGRIVFDLMPETFTLTELQRAFEIILDQKLLVANFRRKMAGYVVETEEIVEGAGHRPAKRFRRNLEAFYR